MALRQFSKAFTPAAGPGYDVKTDSSAMPLRSPLADNRRRVQNLQGPVFDRPAAKTVNVHLKDQPASKRASTSKKLRR
jgi:hypothetical protein